MKALVTGVAGFIASHLAERLLAEGHEVVGVDALLNNYAESEKLRNLRILEAHARFTGLRLDLSRDLIPGGEYDAIFHFAGLPGVRASWGSAFVEYLQHNVAATHALLERLPYLGTPRLVYASSSSLYGRVTGQIHEDLACNPVSPYGVSKLAGESLVRAYAEARGLSWTALRLFTVYGPRQRPDMAIRFFVDCLRAGKPVPLHGLTTARDLTYVGDAVQAALLAAEKPANAAINVSGGRVVSIPELVELLASELQVAPVYQELQLAQGEPEATWASLAKAESLLGYVPRMDLATGLAAQIAWMDSVLPREPGR